MLQSLCEDLNIYASVRFGYHAIASASASRFRVEPVAWCPQRPIVLSELAPWICVSQEQALSAIRRYNNVPAKISPGAVYEPMYESRVPLMVVNCVESIPAKTVGVTPDGIPILRGQ